MALNLKTLTTRALTAAVFVGVLLSCIIYNYLSFSLLFLIVSVWGLVEFYEIAEKLGAKPFKGIGILSAIVIYVSGVLHFQNAISFSDLPIIGISFCLVFFIFITALFSKNQDPIKDIMFTLGGIVYSVIPFVLLNGISCIEKFPYNPHIILGIMFLIWGSDTFAYLVGSLMGKHKLYERVSPGKTWEGSIGGAILTLASTLLISRWFPELNLIQWMITASIIVVFGTCGDLVESMLKRQANIKDSGKIMPGHGGILDRFDSLLFVSPFLYAYLSWVFA